MNLTPHKIPNSKNPLQKLIRIIPLSSTSLISKSAFSIIININLKHRNYSFRLYHFFFLLFHFFRLLSFKIEEGNFLFPHHGYEKFKEARNKNKNKMLKEISRGSFCSISNLICLVFAFYL